MNQYLETYADILHKINELMKFLHGLNQPAKLRQRIPLRPVTRQETRWSSTFAMVERYFKLKPFLDSVDDELAVYMSFPLEDKRLCGALNELKYFESVSKKLQDERGLTLAAVRALF
ncbi:hypothetical protein JG688_00018085 [Phytophthora aleatoria]|uniref:Uncharacterized protein n=1 Tax=Phytophthora aleatoria TaxID=2496075 RepID=A0A8J5I013_9STRA|nr:hypothetical protein JG688_00018085 [Phytophthora aleatoria]